VDTVYIYLLAALLFGRWNVWIWSD